MIASSFALTAWVSDNLYHPSQANTYPASVNPGDRNVLIEVQLRNVYTKSYHNISAQLIPSPPFNGVATRASVTRIDPNGTANIYYKVDVDPSAVPGEYTLYEMLEYDYYDTITTTAYPGSTLGPSVHVSSKRTLTVNVDFDQKITIRDVHFEPNRVLPAQETTLYATVENTGSITLNNLDVAYQVLTDATTVNIAPETVTKKTVDVLLPGEKATVAFLMKAIDMAKVQSYGFGVSVGSQSGSVTTKTDGTVLDIIGKPDIRLAGVQVDKNTVYQNQPFSLSLQFENIGTGDAKSTRVNLADHDFTGVTVSYIGEIKVDDTGSAIFDLKDPVPGKKVVTADVAYEDKYGGTFTRSETVQYVIVQQPPDYMTPVIAVLVVIVAAVWLWRSRQKKKRIEKLVK
jgi:hypothetical protein